MAQLKRPSLSKRPDRLVQRELPQANRCGAASDDERSSDPVPPQIRNQPEIEPLGGNPPDASFLEKTDCDHQTVFTKRTREPWRTAIATA
jgi:hypothetical protein